MCSSSSPAPETLSTSSLAVGIGFGKVELGFAAVGCVVPSAVPFKLNVVIRNNKAVVLVVVAIGDAVIIVVVVCSIFVLAAYA